MAVAYVQSANNLPGGGTATTTVKAFSGAVGAGALLIATVTWTASTGAASFSDSVNGAWGATVYTVNDGGNGQSGSTGHFPGSAAGTPTVTATHVSTSGRGIIISEYSGAATSSAIDGTPNSQTNGNNTTQTSGTVTVSQAGDLVYGWVMDDQNGSAIITSSDVTINGGTTGQGPSIAADGVDMAAGSKIGPASGTTTVTFAFTANSQCMIQCICFKIAAAAGNAVGAGLTLGVLLARRRLTT